MGYFDAYPCLQQAYTWIGFFVVLIVVAMIVIWAMNRYLGTNLPQFYLGVGYAGDKWEVGEGMIGLPCMTRITENKLAMAKYNDSSMPCIPDPRCAQ